MFTVTIFQFFWRHLKNTIQKTSSSLSWMKPNVLNTLSVLTSTYQSFCTKVHQGFIFKYQVILCRKVLQVIIFTNNETCRCSFAIVLQYFGATWKLESLTCLWIGTVMHLLVFIIMVSSVPVFILLKPFGIICMQFSLL